MPKIYATIGFTRSLVKSFAMLTYILKLIKVLNSEDDPAQIAWAVCFAALFGFTPTFSLHNLLVVFLVLIFRINITAFILFSALFAGASYLLAPIFLLLGNSVLEMQSLGGIWTALYNTSIGRLSHFNNTLVMGGIVSALLIWAPLYFATRSGIVNFRVKALPWIEKAHVVRVLKASRVYRLYADLG